MSKSQIEQAIPHALRSVDFPALGEKQSGKVRDYYVRDKQRVMFTTDRLSAFDVVLGTVPYKGAVLNMLAAYWFGKTKHIVPNHLIDIPHPNIAIAEECDPIPVEMIVRGYLTGVTKTSPWYSYKQGERNIYGLHFPEGMQKNDKLPEPIITPTTHGGPSGHDERLTREQILSRKIVAPEIYAQMEEAALQLFAFGTLTCAAKGIILVDTKYEFGLDERGQVILMDEIHTPDSSRFWDKDSYAKRVANGFEPINMDKEIVRKWYAEQGYTGDGVPPALSNELKVLVSILYLAVHEKITGGSLAEYHYPVMEALGEVVANL